MIQQLTKQSTDQEIKAYFEEVLRLSRDSEEFPVNLDDVWPLVYLRKDKAVRSLQSNDLFMQGVDYKFFPIFLGKPWGPPQKWGARWLSLKLAPPKWGAR